MYTNESEAIPYVYVYLEGDRSASLTKESYDYLIENLDNMIAKNVSMTNIKNLAGFSGSASAFTVVGDDDFNNPYDYLGAFETKSATVMHAKGSYAQDPNGNVQTYGVGYDTSYVGLSEGASNYWMINPSEIENLAQKFIDMKKATENEIYK